MTGLLAALADDLGDDIGWRLAGIAAAVLLGWIIYRLAGPDWPRLP